MILTIPKDEEVLRQKCEPLMNFADASKVKDSLFIEIVTSKAGMHGLAAPQIGIRLQVCAVVNAPIFYMFNPIVIWRSKRTDVDTEGCMSIPSKVFKVERATKIRVFAQDQDGNEHEQLFHGALARIVQHEIDHLNGVMVDKIGRFYGTRR